MYSYLRERGFEVITCPETFTILASNGMSLDFFETEGGNCESTFPGWFRVRWNLDRVCILSKCDFLISCSVDFSVLLVGMDTVIQNSVLDVQLSIEESLERVLRARGKPAGTYGVSPLSTFQYDARSLNAFHVLLGMKSLAL